MQLASLRVVGRGAGGYPGLLKIVGQREAGGVPFRCHCTQDQTNETEERMRYWPASSPIIVPWYSSRQVILSTRLTRMDLCWGIWIVVLNLQVSFADSNDRSIVGFGGAVYIHKIHKGWLGTVCVSLARELCTFNTTVSAKRCEENERCWINISHPSYSRWREQNYSKRIINQ